MIQGRMIWRGIMGMASIASLSFGTPASISFRLEAESAAANPILEVRSMAMVRGITFSLMMSSSSL